MIWWNFLLRSAFSLFSLWEIISRNCRSRKEKSFVEGTPEKTDVVRVLNERKSMSKSWRQFPRKCGAASARVLQDNLEFNNWTGNVKKSRRRANVRKVSFRISLRCPLNTIINSVNVSIRISLRCPLNTIINSVDTTKRDRQSTYFRRCT